MLEQTRVIDYCFALNIVLLPPNSSCGIYEARATALVEGKRCGEQKDCCWLPRFALINTVVHDPYMARAATVTHVDTFK